MIGLTHTVFEDKSKADKVAAAVHKQIEQEVDGKEATAYVEVRDAKNVA